MANNVVKSIGVNSKAAGRDINIINQKNIIFDPQDLADIIDCIYDNLDELSLDDLNTNGAPFVSDFSLINIDEKNEKNNISADYYNQFIVDDVSYFSKIEKVLKNPKNKDVSKKFLSIMKKIAPKVFSLQEKGESLQELLTEIFDHFYDSQTSFKSGRKDLVQTLAYYAYHNCYIGRK